MSMTETLNGDGLRWRDLVKPGDPEKVRNLCRSSGVFTPEEVQVAGELVEEHLLKGPACGYHFIFVEQMDSMVGYVCFGPTPFTAVSYDIYWIAVEQRHRFHGIGHEILVRCEQLIHLKGGRRIYVETASLPSYLPTRTFYEKNGYVCEALLKDFYEPDNHKIIFVKVMAP
ncbi:MAG: GNAT family N-acetyltransferase [Deltaproteobacteria bacterium]|nr:GNAT family N-acetyltransferase [Deltaproteobacteria bacterium]